MDPAISPFITKVRKRHLEALQDALDESIRGLQNLLRLDEYHRHGHEEPQLQQSLGPFASNQLNLSALSDVLGRSAASRQLPDERLERVHALLDRLGEELQMCRESMEEPAPSIALSEPMDAIEDRTEAHLSKAASIFGHLRMAQLELRSKYDPQTHESYFNSFSWQELSPAELSLCPPLVIYSELNAEPGAALRKASELLESRRPLKIVLQRSYLKRHYPAVSDPSAASNLAIETLPLAMRGVYLLQSSPAFQSFENSFAAAIGSPRPALISVLTRKDKEEDEEFALRAFRAQRCRAFPVVVYDPDRAPGFVACLDLSANPDDQPGFNFAHFAAAEDEFATDLSAPGENMSADSLVEIEAYLSLTRRQRAGKHPCVLLETPQGNRIPKVLSSELVTQFADQLQTWKMLQEIAGQDNPYVRQTRAALEKSFAQEREAMERELQERFEKQREACQHQAIAHAVQTLVTRFTGVNVDSISVDLPTSQESEAAEERG